MDVWKTSYYLGIPTATLEGELTLTKVFGEFTSSQVATLAAAGVQGLEPESPSHQRSQIMLAPNVSTLHLI